MKIFGSRNAHEFPIFDIKKNAPTGRFDPQIMSFGVQVEVTIRKEEATPIARLMGKDRTQTIGWVYQWNTLELSILWIAGVRAIAYVEPPLCPETLARAKSVTTDAVTDLLEAFSTGSNCGLD